MQTPASHGVNNMANCLTFAPVTKPQVWQKLAFNVLGETLPVSYYTTLRNVDPVVDMEMAEEGADLIAVQQRIELPGVNDSLVTEPDNQHLMEKATKAIQEICGLLIDKLESAKDAKMAEGALKFADRIYCLAKSIHGNLASALYNFGASELQKGKNSKK